MLLSICAVIFLLSAHIISMQMDEIDLRHQLPDCIRDAGFNINGRQYPAEKDLHLYTLRQLLDIRPRKVKGLERDHVQYLFGRHPKVKKLDLRRLSVEQFLRGWLDIRRQETSTSPHNLRLSYAITKHLANDPLVDKSLIGQLKKRFKKDDDTEYKRRYNWKQKNAMQQASKASGPCTCIDTSRIISTEVTNPAMKLVQLSRWWLP